MFKSKLPTIPSDACAPFIGRKAWAYVEDRRAIRGRLYRYACALRRDGWYDLARAVIGVASRQVSSRRFVGRKVVV